MYKLNPNLQIPPYRHKALHFLRNGAHVLSALVGQRYFDAPWRCENSELNQEVIVGCLGEARFLGHDYLMRLSQPIGIGLQEFEVQEQLGNYEDSERIVSCLIDNTTIVEYIYARMNSGFNRFNTIVYNVMDELSTIHNWRLEEHKYQPDEIEAYAAFRLRAAKKRMNIKNTA